MIYIRALASVFAVLIHVALANDKCNVKDGVDVAIAIDESGSLDNAGVDKEKNFTALLYQKFDEGTTEIAVFAFSSGVREIVALGTDFDDAAATLSSDVRSSGGTASSAALNRSAVALGDPTGERQKLIVLMSDGRADSQTTFSSEAARLKGLGYVIATIGIGSSSGLFSGINAESLRDAASNKTSGGEEKLYYEVTIDDLPKESTAESVVKDTCSAVGGKVSKGGPGPIGITAIVLTVLIILTPFIVFTTIPFLAHPPAIPPWLQPLERVCNMSHLCNRGPEPDPFDLGKPSLEAGGPAMPPATETQLLLDTSLSPTPQPPPPAFEGTQGAQTLAGELANGQNPGIPLPPGPPPAPQIGDRSSTAPKHGSRMPTPVYETETEGVQVVQCSNESPRVFQDPTPKSPPPGKSNPDESEGNTDSKKKEEIDAPSVPNGNPIHLVVAVDTSSHGCSSRHSPSGGSDTRPSYSTIVANIISVLAFPAVGDLQVSLVSFAGESAEPFKFPNDETSVSDDGAIRKALSELTPPSEEQETERASPRACIKAVEASLELLRGMEMRRKYRGRVLVLSGGRVLDDEMVSCREQWAASAFSGGGGGSVGDEPARSGAVDKWRTSECVVVAGVGKTGEGGWVDKRAMAQLGRVAVIGENITSFGKGAYVKVLKGLFEARNGTGIGNTRLSIF